MGVCGSYSSCATHSTLNSNLKWAEEVHKEEESVMKIWLMYQGQGFNAASQGNSGQWESHTQRRQIEDTATFIT